MSRGLKLHVCVNTLIGVLVLYVVKVECFLKGVQRNTSGSESDLNKS